MRMRELKAALDQAGVRERAYDLEGSSKDEVYCLDKVQGSWVVYYRERGIRREERFFSSEDEACQYIFDLLIRDPTTRL